MSNLVIISESQKRLILRESTKSKLEEKLNTSLEFTNKVVKDTAKITGLDFGFLLTWGAGIGGFFKPVSDFIEGKFPEFTSTDISLIIVSLICTYFIDNKEYISKLITKLKEKNLFEAFKEAQSKTTEFISSFSNFLSTIGITLDKLRKILSYTFIIPILPILINAWDSGILKSDDAKEIGLRILSYGVLTLSSEMVVNFVKKIFSRFPQK